jgi:hypothetical protein
MQALIDRFDDEYNRAAPPRSNVRTNVRDVLRTAGVIIAYRRWMTRNLVCRLRLSSSGLKD